MKSQEFILQGIQEQMQLMKKNNIKLLYRLDGVPMEKRRALFKTVIALVTEKKGYNYSYWRM